MSPQEAGDAARWQHSGSSQPTGTCMTTGGAVGLEGGVCEAVRDTLRSRGHHLSDMTGTFGGYQLIAAERDPRTGRRVYHAASEMRKDGAALAF